MNAAALNDEAGENRYGARIARVFCEDPAAPELWYGTYGNAPVVHGPAGYQFSDGQLVTL